MWGGSCKDSWKLKKGADNWKIVVTWNDSFNMNFVSYIVVRMIHVTFLDRYQGHQNIK